MPLNIPNSFATRTQVIRLAYLDENFTSVSTFVNTLSETVDLLSSNVIAINFALETDLATISSNVAALQGALATTSVAGAVRPDGTSILVTSGVISVANPINSTSWTVRQSSNGSLYFFHNNVAKMRLDSSGTITVVGDLVAFGTI